MIRPVAFMHFRYHTDVNRFDVLQVVISSVSVYTLITVSHITYRVSIYFGVGAVRLDAFFVGGVVRDEFLRALHAARADCDDLVRDVCRVTPICQEFTFGYMRDVEAIEMGPTSLDLRANPGNVVHPPSVHILRIPVEAPMN